MTPTDRPERTTALQWREAAMELRRKAAEFEARAERLEHEQAPLSYVLTPAAAPFGARPSEREG